MVPRPREIWQRLFDWEGDQAERDKSPEPLHEAVERVGVLFVRGGLVVVVVVVVAIVIVVVGRRVGGKRIQCCLSTVARVTSFASTMGTVCSTDDAVSIAVSA